MGRRWAAYTTLAGHRTDVVMAPRSTGRSGIPKKPVSERTKAFEQHDEQSHKEEVNFYPFRSAYIKINVKNYIFMEKISKFGFWAGAEIILI